MTPSERQENYELRRRSRLLGLAIDQCLTGIKNIIIFSDNRFWPEDKPQWGDVKSNAEEVLLQLMKLERKLAITNPNIYSSMIPNNPETTRPTEIINE